MRIINLETAVTLHDEPWPYKGIQYRMHPGQPGSCCLRLDLLQTAIYISVTRCVFCREYPYADSQRHPGGFGCVSTGARGVPGTFPIFNRGICWTEF